MDVCCRYTHDINYFEDDAIADFLPCRSLQKTLKDTTFVRLRKWPAELHAFAWNRRNRKCGKKKEVWTNEKILLRSRCLLTLEPEKHLLKNHSQENLYQSPIKMCKAHFNCDIVIGMRHIFAMLTLSSRKCNAGTALKTDWNEYFNRFSVLVEDYIRK